MPTLSGVILIQHTVIAAPDNYYLPVCSRRQINNLRFLRELENQ